MGEKSADTQKQSWFKGLKSEFKRVSWPDKNTLSKQTAAVVSISVVLGLIISLLDTVLKYGIDLLVR